MPTPKQVYDKQRYAANKREINRRSVEWVKQNREKHRQYELKCRYGLTPEQLKRMQLEQDNKCKICKVKPTYTLCIDHNHKTGKVRGLLCKRCNIAVGFIEVEGLSEKIHDYLK